ncbi:MAG: histidinol-phosphatase [Spirochaetaceae bacterium]|jgi:histidinol-phosphatase (PHP family)|nr:histidinol-phosphatase [Spirochaetaceae bacterium]
MQYSCLHTHTRFCDGHDDIETFCEAAYRKGFASIGFSAHAPLPRSAGLRSDWHLREDRLEAYISEVRAAEQRWEGKIRVFLGLEADYISGIMSPADSYFQSLDLDYLIGSVHYLVPPKGAPFTVDDAPEKFEQGLREGFSGDADALTGAYWDAVQAMIYAGGFAILGHADLIRKNNAGNRWFSPESAAYRRRIESLTLPAPLVVEVNTGGMTRYAMPEPYPSLALLKRFREMNIPAVITADAHRAEHLDGHYEEARSLLLKAGYASAVLFNGETWIIDAL